MNPEPKLCENATQQWSAREIVECQRNSEVPEIQWSDMFLWIVVLQIVCMQWFYGVRRHCGGKQNDSFHYYHYFIQQWGEAADLTLDHISSREKNSRITSWYPPLLRASGWIASSVKIKNKAPYLTHQSCQAKSKWQYRAYHARWAQIKKSGEIRFKDKAEWYSRG